MTSGRRRDPACREVAAVMATRGGRRRQPPDARYALFARHVLPEFLRLLDERAERSSANVTGTVLAALLASAAATVGSAATPGCPDDAARDDDWLPRTWLYRRLLAARRARFGPTPNRVPHGGYASAEVRVAAQSLMDDDARTV